MVWYIECVVHIIHLGHPHLIKIDGKGPISSVTDSRTSTEPCNENNIIL